MGFSYAVQNLAEENRATEAPKHRSLDLPFGDNGVANDEEMRGQMQCMAVDSSVMAGAQNVDLYPYMAFGGDSPTYDVTMTMEGEDDMVMDVAHQFRITMNDMDIAELSGQPNTAAGSHNWIINARDSTSDQHVSRSWMLQVVQQTYSDRDGRNSDIGTSVTVEDPDPDTDPLTVIDWADFISSQFNGEGALVQEDVRGGIPASLNLATGLDPDDPMSAGAGMISGKINEDVGDIADADVFWVGALTPDSVLNVKVEGTFESPNAPGVYNDVSVALHSFVSGETKSVAETAGMSATEGYDEYKGIDCNLYYLEVSGGEGGYDLSWTFTE